MAVLGLACHSVEDNRRSFYQVYGQQFKFPDELYVVKAGSFYAQKQKMDLSDGLTLLTIIDGNCSSCVGSLRKWDAYFKALRQKGEFNPVVVVQTQDTVTFLHNYEQMGGVSYPVYLDINKRLKESNAIWDKSKYRTFLLNTRNEVILIGNPLHNPKLEKLYRGQIQKHGSPKKAQ